MKTIKEIKSELLFHVRSCAESAYKADEDYRNAPKDSPMKSFLYEDYIRAEAQSEMAQRIACDCGIDPITIHEILNEE